MKVKKSEWAVLLLLLFCLGQMYAASCGDVNASGSVDIVDALMIAQYSVGLNPSNFNSAVASVNGDSAINIVDALMVAQLSVGLIPQLSCQGVTPTPTITTTRTATPAGASGLPMEPGAWSFKTGPLEK